MGSDKKADTSLYPISDKQGESSTTTTLHIRKAVMYTLRVTVERIDGYCNQPMLVGDSFLVKGGKILLDKGEHICMWALQSMMPIFPLLQRSSGTERDWTGKVNQFCCPDPKGKVHYRIERIDSK